MDVDGDGALTALGDGLMILRKIINDGFGGDALTNGAMNVSGATRNTDDIHTYIQNARDDLTLDVDEDGKVTALGDGLMILRKLINDGFVGDALTNGARAEGANRSPQQIHEYIESLRGGL